MMTTLCMSREYFRGRGGGFFVFIFVDFFVDMISLGAALWASLWASLIASLFFKKTDNCLQKNWTVIYSITVLEYYCVGNVGTQYVFWRAKIDWWVRK